MRGSDKKVAVLFARYRDDLFRYVTRYAGDADLAEDVVQETFVKLRERMPSNQLCLRGWLFKVATNLVRDHLSVSKRRHELECQAAPDLPQPSSAPDPAAMAELEDLRERVRRALDSLTDDERTVLLMYQEGFRHREIAEAVDRRTESVGSIIVRAAKKVAVVLEMEAAL